VTASKVPRRERSFEEALARLEEIVGQIEAEQLGLEKQFELFQEGMSLARYCDGKLSEVQKSVEIVLKEAAEWKTVPFAAEDEGDDDDSGRD
jgi:exodeoxyribonuclease VII small subunit